MPNSHAERLDAIERQLERHDEQIRSLMKLEPLMQDISDKLTLALAIFEETKQASEIRRRRWWR